MQRSFSLPIDLHNKIQFQKDTLALKQGGREDMIFVLSLLVTNASQRLKNYSLLSSLICKQN